jgi:hypothetical protein
MAGNEKELGRGSVFEDIAKKIFDKEKVTSEELEFAIQLDMAFVFGQMSVSATETRAVRPYETNAYFASVQFDLTEVKALVRSRVDRLIKDGAPNDQVVQAYLDAKKAVFIMIGDKYARTEDYLRKLIHEQQRGDGISGVSKD